MRNFIICSLLIISSISFTYSQGYNTGVGVRVGFSNGLTVKHFINKKAAIEGVLSTRWKGFNITGLYEVHNNTGLYQLNWYYGTGAHIGFWNGKNVKWANDNNDYIVIGIDGVIGLEYIFDNIPFNVSLDWKPTMNLIGHSEFWGDNGAISLRYIF